jgi:hypothetical protein
MGKHEDDFPFIERMDENPRELHIADDDGNLIVGSGVQQSGDLYARAATRDITTLSDLIPQVIHVEKGWPFRYIDIIQQMDGSTIRHNRSYLKPIYDLSIQHPEGSRNMILMWARQCEKSTTAACKSIALMASIPNMKALFIQPRFAQVSVFSQQRFKKIAEDSPRIAEEMLSTMNIWQVGMKEFNNGSIANFRSCYLSADATRGVSADLVNIDELQDIVSDEVPVIEETQSHALPDRFFRIYTGTPKSKMNVLPRRYDLSSQFEWMVKCRWCPHWNFLDEKVIGDKSFICTKCGKELYPKKHKNPFDPNDFGGEWVAMRPSKLDECFGFRISQIQVPFQSFKRVHGKLHDPEVPFPVFQNEALGLASEEGELVLTEQDIRNACEEDRKAWDRPDGIKRVGRPMFMGIDHGTGMRSTDTMGKARKKRAFTVVTIGTFGADEKFRIHYMEKFLGERSDLVKQPAMFDKLARQFGVVFCGSDYGFGHINNESLIDNYGWKPVDVGTPDPVMLEMQSTQQRALVKFDPKAGKYGRYLIDRFQNMRAVIDTIKKARIRFPMFELMKNDPNPKLPFIDDFTSIFIEYDDYHKSMRYDHTLPDDAFQSTMLCWLAARQYYGEYARTIVPAVNS